jgi:hypothetical protein
LKNICILGSWSTQSFIFKESFQEIAHILAKATFCSRIDWLKDLKKNIIPSDMLAVVTGFKGLA